MEEQVVVIDEVIVNQRCGHIWSHCGLLKNSLFVMMSNCAGGPLVPRWMTAEQVVEVPCVRMKKGGLAGDAMEKDAQWKAQWLRVAVEMAMNTADAADAAADDDMVTTTIMRTMMEMWTRTRTVAWAWHAPHLVGVDDDRVG